MIDTTFTTNTELFEEIKQELYKQLSKHLNGSVTISEYKELLVVEINVFAIHYNKALFKSDILRTITDAPCIKDYITSLINLITDDYCKYICDRFFI